MLGFAIVPPNLQNKKLVNSVGGARGTKTYTLSITFENGHIKE